MALTKGSVRMISLLGESLYLDGPIWPYTAALSLNLVGFAIVALFRHQVGRRRRDLEVSMPRGAVRLRAGTIIRWKSLTVLLMPLGSRFWGPRSPHEATCRSIASRLFQARTHHVDNQHHLPG
jgi:hypothetical protein